MELGIAAAHADDLGTALRLARQALQIPTDVPGWRARAWSANYTQLLIIAGDLSAAEHSCMAGLARAEEVSDVYNRARLLVSMADLEVQVGRVDVAAARLNEALAIATRTNAQFTLINALECTGFLCAATGRFGEAITEVFPARMSPANMT